MDSLNRRGFHRKNCTALFDMRAISHNAQWSHVCYGQQLVCHILDKESHYEHAFVCNDWSPLNENEMYLGTWQSGNSSSYLEISTVWFDHIHEAWLSRPLHLHCCHSENWNEYMNIMCESKHSDRSYLICFWRLTFWLNWISTDRWRYFLDMWMYIFKVLFVVFQLMGCNKLVTYWTKQIIRSMPEFEVPNHHGAISKFLWTSL